MPCFKTQLTCPHVVFFFVVFFLFCVLYREINKGFCGKTVNRIAGFFLKTMGLSVVGTKILH